MSTAALVTMLQAALSVLMMIQQNPQMPQTDADAALRSVTQTITAAQQSILSARQNTTNNAYQSAFQNDMQTIQGGNTSGSGVYSINPFNPAGVEPPGAYYRTAPATMCTQDAILCPNGKYVGRSGPNCTFSCNGTNTNAEDYDYQDSVIDSDGNMYDPGVSTSGEGYSSGAVGNGDTSFACTAPTKPAITCSNGAVLSFYGNGNTTNGICGGSWVCAIGM